MSVQICRLALFFFSFLPAVLFSQTSSDFYMISIAKSGTNLLSKCIEKVIHKKRLYCPNEYIDPDYKLKNKYLGTHFLHTKAIAEIERSFPSSKKVINIRDPRDIFVSAAFFYHYLTYRFPGSDNDLKKGPSFDNISIKDRIKTYLIEGMRGRKIPSPIYDIKAACKFLKNHSDYFLVKFEDLVGQQGQGSKKVQIACIQELANYLEIDITVDEIENITTEIFGGTHTFRKGKVGDWKNYFDEDMKRMFKALLGEELIYLGYEKDNNW